MLGRVVVVGCGLIGGSIVKGLRERKAASTLSAIDRRSVFDEARGWLDAAAEPDAAEAHELVAQADVVVLAAPVAVIVASLSAVLDRLSAEAVVTDCGSVKRPMALLAAGHARGRRFVPGHPMAGREVGGFAMSSPRLLDGCRWYLVRPSGADAAVTDSSGAATVTGASSGAGTAIDPFGQVEQLVRALGATPIETNADDHDRAMAYVSHAPQIVASALVDAAAAAGVIDDAGPGFRDTTRIAGGPEAIWRDILAANHANVVQAIDAIIERLAASRDELAKQTTALSGADAPRDAGPRNQAPRAAAIDETLHLLERARRAKGS